MRKTALIYARVSTAKQAAEELPIASQIDQCRAKAAALGAEVLRVFEDRGISGRDEDRPGFQDAVAFAESDRVTYFVTWSTSRFARDAVVAGVYKRRLEKRGVELAYCTADIDRSTTSGFILDSVLSMIDEVYSRQVSVDTQRSLMNNARAGHWNGGRVPFGYQPAPALDDARRRRLVPLPDEAWLVQRFFRRATEGAGPLTIAAEANADGHLHRGQRWTSSAVSHVLNSPASAGRVVFNRRASRHSSAAVKPESEWVSVQAHEAIVDLPTWDRVQAIRQAGKRRETGSSLSTHVFTGILACGHCGAQMQVERATGRSASYSYYNCRSWITAKACANRRRRADELDTWLIEQIASKIFTPETMRLVALELNATCGVLATERRSQLAAIDRTVADIGARRRRLVGILELHGVDAPNLADISSRLQELRRDEAAAKQKKNEIEAQPVPEFQMVDRDLEELRDTLLGIVRDASDVPKTRSMLRGLLESAVLHSDRVEINYRTDLLAMPGANVALVHSSKNWLPE